MFQFYSQIITGSIRPHLIKYSNIEKVQSTFFSDKGGSILSDEALKICAEKYGTYKITSDEELKKIVLSTVPEEQLEDLIDMRFPPAPDQKAQTYQILIELEYEKIKLAIDNAIENSNKLDEIEFFTKKNLQKLKTLSRDLGEYIKRLGGNHGDSFVSDSNYFILYILKHHLIDTIQYIQKTTSTYINIQFETTDILLATLFNEAPARLPLTILSLLPKEKTFNTFKQNFIKRNKESLLDNNASKRGLSIGKALLDFYKAKSKGLDKETQLANYFQNIHYWDELLITGELEVIEYGKKINEPEVEQILLPLLKNEIELLQVITTSSMAIDTDIKSNSEFTSAPQSEQVVRPYKDVMNINDLVEYTGISKSTIHKLTSAGTIPFYKKGKPLSFVRLEIDEWRKEKRGYNVDEINKEAIKSVTLDPRQSKK